MTKGRKWGPRLVPPHDESMESPADAEQPSLHEQIDELKHALGNAQQTAALRTEMCSRLTAKIEKARAHAQARIDLARKYPTMVEIAAARVEELEAILEILT